MVMADHPGTIKSCSSVMTTHHHFYHRMLSLRLSVEDTSISTGCPHSLNMETETTVLAYLEVSHLLVDAFLLLGAEVERWKRRHTLIERSMIHVIVL